MPVIEAHFFAPDDLNGATIFECSTDDSFVKQIKLDIQRDKLGSATINLARKVPVGLFSRDIVAPDVLVRYLIPAIDPDRYLWANFIDVRQQKVVSKAEKGGEGFTFGGPGPKYYLTRTVLWSASFAGYDSSVDKENHIWHWPGAARAGAILNRLFIEDAANPSGPFLPDLTNSFNDTDDSNGDPWADDISEGNEDFTLRIRDDYLKILWKLEDVAPITTQIDLGTVADPKLQLDAYQDYGRDLTGDLAFDTVHFIEGVNIAADLDIEGESFRKASHALMEGNDGLYELSLRPGVDAFKRVIGGSYETNSPTVLDKAGIRLLQRQDSGEEESSLTIVPGFAPGQGLYLPGPDGTNGHFWVGDTVSRTTGQATQTELDYNEEPAVVTGIQMELVDAVSEDSTTKVARSFETTVQFNEERKTSNGRPNVGNRGNSEPPTSALRLCRAATEGSEDLLKLYPQVANHAFNPSESAIWDSVTVSQSKNLAETPDASQTTVVSATAGGSGVTTDCMLHQEVFTVDAALAAVLVAGGAEYHGQAVCRARSGIGITEAAQDLISQIEIRVFDSGGTLRGTVLAAHTLANSSGSVKWLAHLNGRNAMFPPAAAPTNVLSALAGCVAGDRLVIEYGYRNFTVPAATGGSLLLNGNAASDLPEDETTLDHLNSWHRILASGSGATPGDLPQDTVRQGEESAGTDGRASRCDHEHAHGLLDAGGENYHSVVHVATEETDTSLVLSPDGGGGMEFRAESVPVVPDDLDDLTDVVITTPVVDDDLRYDGASWVNDPRKWEAVTGGEDIFVWEGDDLVHEWNEAP